MFFPYTKNKIFYNLRLLFILITIPSQGFSQSKYSIELGIGGNLSFSKKITSTTNFDLVRPLILYSSLQGIYLSDKITPKYDLLLGFEFYQSGIRAASRTSEQRLIYDLPNLASGQYSFNYRHLSFPISIRYNLKTKKSNFNILIGLGYTYSRSGYINYTCFSRSSIEIDGTIIPSGSVFCVTELNKNSNHNLFFRLGVGYDYEINKIGNFGIKAAYNLGINFMDEVLYEITFLNGDNYKTWIGNKGNRLGVSIVYKRKIKTAWNKSSIF